MRNIKEDIVSINIKVCDPYYIDFDKTLNNHIMNANNGKINQSIVLPNGLKIEGMKFIESYEMEYSTAIGRNFRPTFVIFTINCYVENY